MSDSATIGQGKKRRVVFSSTVAMSKKIQYRVTLWLLNKSATIGQKTRATVVEDFSLRPMRQESDLVAAIFRLRSQGYLDAKAKAFDYDLII